MSQVQWSSRIGHVLAAAGSAIGLGAIWKFPYVTATNGGGAFLLVFLLFSFTLGVAVLVAYSPQNGVILLVIAFLVSPLGLPMAAAWLVSKVQDLRYAIQDAVYG